MISTKNPFPGMNPFLEKNWPPVHTLLISSIWTEIAVKLPPDLIARPEERLTVEQPERFSYRADVAVSESWREGVPPAWAPQPGGAITVTEPEVWRLVEVIERWIEIRTADGRLVTVIEILSPANKLAAFAEYKQKQLDYRLSSANLVEIDLLRGGKKVLQPPAGRALAKPGAPFHIASFRAARHSSFEVWRWTLRERIPAFRIPLRETDADIALDLQPLLDRCYEAGRYYLDRHDASLIPPFSPDDAAWVEARLQAAGLRPPAGG